MMTQVRPQPGDFAPYAEKYIALVPNEDAIEILEAQLSGLKLLLDGLTPHQANFRYAPDKWSIKEVIGHLSDTERIFTYRATRIARGDQTPLSGFEQDDYVRAGNFNARTLADVLEEFSTVRRATLSLLRSFDAAALARRGVANQNEVTVLALEFIIAGHERHHRKILEERYIPVLPRG